MELTDHKIRPELKLSKYFSAKLPSLPDSNAHECYNTGMTTHIVAIWTRQETYCIL